MGAHVGLVEQFCAGEASLLPIQSAVSSAPVGWYCEHFSGSSRSKGPKSFKFLVEELLRSGEESNVISVRLAVRSCILSYICTLISRAYSEPPANSNVFHRKTLSFDGSVSSCSTYKHALFSHCHEEGCSASGNLLNERLV